MKELTAKQLRNEVVNKLWTYGNLPKNIQEFMGDEVAFMLEIIDTKVKEQLTLTDVGIALADEEYEPYFGWCDVDGCKNEGCSGGSAWRDTGYWTVCHKHSDEHRKGFEQPKMKQSSVERENKRDKKKQGI